jgi:hypothetical protein
MAQAMENTSYRLVKSEVCDLTPELAQQFRELDPSPTERELNAARIKHLKTKAEAGQLVTFHWSVAKLGDKRLRMNGQHSSNMLCDLNGHFPEGPKGSHRRIRGPEQAITRPAVSAVRRPQVEPITE